MNLRAQGFTLVEILTVVAIIGILSGLSLGPIQTARMRGRDTERKADVNAIAQASDLYYSEKKVYPGNDGSTCTQYSSDANGNWNELEAALKSYMPASKTGGLPVDPLNKDRYRYTYSCSVSGGTFSISARLENKNDLEGTLIDLSNPESGKKYEITR